MCSEPSRLVWPSLAVALSGRSTSPFRLHGHQRMPALALDLRHVADRDVGDPHPRVLLQIVDVGHLRLDREGARAAALSARQRQRVQPAPVGAARQSRNQATTTNTRLRRAARVGR